MSASLPDPGAGRRRLMAVVLAAVRAVAGWLVTRADLLALLDPASPLGAAAGRVPGIAAAVLVGAGLALFVWPRSCLAAAAFLAACLAAADYGWRHAGVVPPVGLPWALAVLAVLAAREWLGRRLTRS